MQRKNMLSAMSATKKQKAADYSAEQLPILPAMRKAAVSLIVFFKFPCFTVLNNFKKYIKLYSNSQDEINNRIRTFLSREGEGLAR